MITLETLSIQSQTTAGTVPQHASPAAMFL